MQAILQEVWYWSVTGFVYFLVSGKLLIYLGEEYQANKKVSLFWIIAFTLVLPTYLLYITLVYLLSGLDFVLAKVCKNE